MPEHPYREVQPTFYYVSYFAKIYPGYDSSPYWTVIKDEHPLVWLAKTEATGRYHYVCLISWQQIPEAVWQDYCTNRRAAYEASKHKEEVAPPDDVPASRWNRFVSWARQSSQQG